MSEDINRALFWAKIGDIGILYLPIFAYYFVIVLLNINSGIYKSILSVAFVLSIPILLLSQTNYCFIGMRAYSWGHYPLAGPLYILLILFFSLFVACIPMLYNAIRNKSNYSQSKLLQIKYVLFAFIGACTGFVDYLPKYNITIYPWGHISVLVFISIITFAILKHHLMDIRVIIRKGLLYSAVVAVVTGMYITFIAIFNQLIISNDWRSINIIWSSSNMNRMLNYYSLSMLINFFSLIILGLFVLIYDYKNKINQTYALLNISMGLWCFFWALWMSTPDYGLAFIFLKTLMVFAATVPVLFMHFVYNILEIKHHKSWLIPLMYLFCFICIYLNLNNMLYVEMRPKMGLLWWPDAGGFFVLYLIYFYFGVIMALYLMGKAYLNATATEKNKLRYLIIAASLATIGGSLSFPLWYDIPITPFLNLLITLYALLVAYSILKHHLMDITVVIRKGLLYSLLIGLLSAFYLSMVFVFGNYLGGRRSAASILFTIFSIIFFSLIFQPLRDRVQDFIDKVFFRGKYDYQKTLKELSLAARSIAGIDELADNILSSVVNIIKIKNAALFVLDKNAQVFLPRKIIGEQIPLIPQMFISKLQISKEPMPVADPVEKQELNCDIVFPIVSRDVIVGLLCLGEKLSGEVYSDEDINLLTTLTNQMGVSIENATLYEDALEAQKKLYQADKLATVGALAAGLAHEIKNPIAAIKGFSQVIDQAIIDKDSEAIKDFKDVVPRQLDRINEIVEKLLTLSKPPKMEMKKSDINALLDDIIKLVEKQAMKQKVEIIRTFGELPETKADPEQLTQAFLNLLLNAIQSMPDGGQVEIRTRSMGADKLEIEFIDNGIGISKEKFSKIFDPFFTTRSGGTGLGLSVTRQIIINHHGKIEVESETGIGTKFKVILPVK